MWRKPAMKTWLAFVLPLSLYGSGGGFMVPNHGVSSSLRPGGAAFSSRGVKSNAASYGWSRVGGSSSTSMGERRLGRMGSDDRGEGHKRSWNRVRQHPRRSKIASDVGMGAGPSGGEDRLDNDVDEEDAALRRRRDEEMLGGDITSSSSGEEEVDARGSGAAGRWSELVGLRDDQCKSMRASFELRASAVPAGDESASAASSWQRRLSAADEDRRIRSPDWLVSDFPTRATSQPWELRALSLDEQVSHLSRGLQQLSATFGWCVTDAEAAELDRYNRQVLQDASYLTPTEQQWVGVAVQVAYHAHQGQRRKSGEPFIEHPVEVMKILAGLRMDAETLVAGLLHDTVEDTRLAFADIEAQFGSTVRRIVEGETKLSKIPGRVSAFTASMFEMEGAATSASNKDAAKQADNLRHMLIAMSKDWRVLVVKLADRLHNMRTLGAMAQHKQVRIAHETMGVFVPLARRMGLWQIKTELEDRCFRTLHPEDYDHVTELLRLRAVTTGHSDEMLEDERQRLQDVLSRSLDLDSRVASFRVTVGAKPAYTVWRSMQRNGGLLGGVLDCIHFTIVFSLHPQPGPDGIVRSSFENSERERAACYRLLESAHGLLTPISPPRVEDFIAVPKPNSYRALHSTVMLRGKPVEVQILTDDMYRVAQFGLASQASRSIGNPKNLPWLAELQTSAEACALGCGDTYSANVRDSLTRAQERRFVFDPQGMILDLAANATMCDAARELHDSKTCRVAATYVNGRLVPLNRRLKNGDVVAILTAPFPEVADASGTSSSSSSSSGSRAGTEAGSSSEVAPLHVHTGVWPWSMVSKPMCGGMYTDDDEEPDRLTEIDYIPEMTEGERRLAREVELKWSRLSMFAVLAWTAVEVERVTGLVALRPDAMDAFHESPLTYLEALTPEQALRGVMGMGVLECMYLLFNAIQDRFEGEQSGRSGDGQQLTHQEEAMLERRKTQSRERELHYGRIAMIAIVCLSMQSLVTGEDSLARLFGLF